MLRLSQGHLNLLEKCPPKFQQSYLSQASSLPKPETEDRQTWGSRFHLLMQQRELGLPIEPLLRENTELSNSLKALIKAAPELLIKNQAQTRKAEHSLTLNFRNYLLTVIYDLLIAESDRAKIIDWKTYLQPQKKHKLARNWQTRLYLYVLAETSHYSPEQLSMTYWFVKLPTKPTSHTFIYNQKLHNQTREDLTQLLDNLDLWLSCDRQNSFPHQQKCESICPYFQELLVDNIDSSFKNKNVSDLDILQDEIENIAEVSI